MPCRFKTKDLTDLYRGTYLLIVRVETSRFNKLRYFHRDKMDLRLKKLNKPVLFNRNESDEDALRLLDIVGTDKKKSLQRAKIHPLNL